MPDTKDLEPPSAVAERVLDECVDPDREVPFHFKLDHDKATAIIAEDRRAAVAKALEPVRELLEPLRKLSVNATGGPWCWHYSGESWVMGTALDDDDTMLSGEIRSDEGTPVDYVCEAGDCGKGADADLITALRNALPELLALLTAAEAEGKGE